MKITKPGIYTMSSADYHSDPCDPMSLSSTGARKLVSDCPAMFKFGRDNQTHNRAFDIGTAAHLMVLEPEKLADQVVIVQGYSKDGKPSDGYRTQDAKDQRDAAYEAGKTPLLAPEYERVKAMRDVIWNDPIASKAFADGVPEQSMFWQDQETGVWCRSRPDFMPKHGKYMVDYKSAASAHPDEFRRAIHNFGYHQQAAWYMEGYEVLTGVRPEAFYFIVQMKEPPFLVSIIRLDAATLAIGETLNRYARGTLAWCLENDQWPGYVPKIGEPARMFDVGVPHFASAQYERDLESGKFEIPVTKKD